MMSPCACGPNASAHIRIVLFGKSYNGGLFNMGKELVYVCALEYGGLTHGLRLVPFQCEVYEVLVAYKSSSRS